MARQPHGQLLTGGFRAADNTLNGEESTALPRKTVLRFFGARMTNVNKRVACDPDRHNHILHSRKNHKVTKGLSWPVQTIKQKVGI